jgi:hypothetical protein
LGHHELAVPSTKDYPSRAPTGARLFHSNSLIPVDAPEHYRLLCLSCAQMAQRAGVAALDA